jgi:CRP/FNR family cyclic AMP-dependent transcriptional regulator
MQLDTDRAALVAQNPALAVCPEQTLELLLQRGTLQAFNPGDLLFQEHGPGGVVLFLLGGALQIGKTATRGRRQVICNFGSTNCGGVCLLTLPDRSPADVRAVGSGQVLILERGLFQEVTEDDRVLCRTAWEAAAECMAHLSTLVEHLSFNKVAERVALALLDNTAKDGDLVRRTQSELAAEVGTTREVVARCLAGLQMAGAVRLGRARITVLSREKLRQQI